MTDPDPVRATVDKPRLQVECPECGQVIPVPLVLLIGDPVDGDVPVEVEPDTADLWAHAWTHTEIQP